MAVHLTEKHEGKILEVEASGKLALEDYQLFVPEFERLLKKHGKVSVLFEMKDFHGWEPGALWEDIKFDIKHFADIDRIAMVGDKKWEAAMSDFCRPFTRASIRYFDHSELEQAREWIASGRVEAAGRPAPTAPPS